MAELDIPAVAQELLVELDQTRVVTPQTQRYPDLDFPTAYLVAAERQRLRRARGEQPVSPKIGYTNRNISPQYDVHQPIWDHVSAHTVQQAHDNSTVGSLVRMVAPRIEPEIAFSFCAPLSVGCKDPAVILRSVEWMALPSRSSTATTSIGSSRDPIS